MISDIPTGFCNTGFNFRFLKFFWYYVYVFSEFNLHMLLLVQISYTSMMGKRKKLEFSVGLNW